MKKSGIFIMALVLVFLTSCNQGAGSSSRNSGDESLSSSLLASSELDASGNASVDSANTSSTKTQGNSAGVTPGNSFADNGVSSLSSAPAESKVVVSRIVNKNGRYYPEYLGNPYLMYGVQIRLDNIRADGVDDIDEWEKYWQMLKNLNMQTIEIQVCWTAIEPIKDVYDFYDLELAIRWCEKYDLNMQIIWFGSNVAGGPTDVPAYVKNDRVTYPRNPKSPETHIKLDTPAFIDREKRAMQAMMDFIEQKDKNHRIMMVQVEAEPDNVQGTAEINWQKPESVAEWMWAGGQADASITLMDQLGRVVKNSNRPMITRAAFIDQSYINTILRGKEYLKKCFNTEGIDMVGIDNYSAKLSAQNELMDYLENLIPNNIAYQPETGAEQCNYISQVLLAFSRANGHLVYELRTADFMPSGLDTGFYRKSSRSWVERDGTKTVDVYPNAGQGTMKESNTSEIRSFNKTIYKASYHIASLNKSNLTAFNLQEWNQATAPNRTSNQVCGKYKISCYSPQSKQGFSMCDTNGDVILLGFGALTQYTIEGKTLSGTASVGYFTKAGKWVEQSSVSLSGNTVTVYAEQCVRISANDIK